MKEVAPDIDFADSSYKSCEMSNEQLSVYLESWDEKKIKITFYNVLSFKYQLDYVVLGVYEKGDEELILNEALASYYEKIPESHPFKVFVIRDINDTDFLKVVAEKVFITKES